MSDGVNSGLPAHLLELLQGGYKRSRYTTSLKKQGDKSDSAECSAVLSPMSESQAALGVEANAIKHGELFKTSRSRVDNKIHGPSRKRRFRLTEDAIEYFQLFSQVKIRRSFPLTSIEKVQSVPGNPTMFQLVFHNFIMELEASNPFEAKSWMDAINECASKWTEDTLTADEDEKELSDIEEIDDLPFSSSEAFSSNVRKQSINSPGPCGGLEFDDTLIQPCEPSVSSATESLDKTFGRQRKPALRKYSYRKRSRTTGMLRRQSTEETGTYITQHKNKKTIRRKLRLVPKFEKQRAVTKTSEDEFLHYKKLHGDFAMIKYPRKNQWAIPSEKIFCVDKDNLQVMWKKTSASRLKPSSSLRLDSILEVRLGQQSVGFEKFPYAEVDEQSFSLVYESVKGKYARLESLDLVCDHPKHFNEWIQGLESLQIGPVTSMFPRRYENTDPILLCLKRYWTLCQENHELSEKDAIWLAQNFNPYIESARVKIFLTEAHSHQHEATLSHGNALKWDGFVLLYNIMCGETGRLYQIYLTYALKYKRLGLTIDEFRKFLKTECFWQEEDCSYHKLKELISFHDHHHRSFKKYVSGNKPSYWKTSSQLLSFAGFISFLRSKQNSPINVLHNTVYQDMNQPLSHYFINSSHNTYLEGDQIKGRSSLDAYVRALLLGSRCIEIDCWDNNLGSEPIIYHGYTLTTKLPFGDVIRTIKEYAFRMSHYPLIISIENHCSDSQQARMAKIFIDELKDELGQSILATENLVEGKNFFKRRLPSPTDLQGKILLKGSYRAQSGKVVSKSASKAASRALLMMKKTSLDLVGMSEPKTPPGQPPMANVDLIGMSEPKSPPGQPPMANVSPSHVDPTVPENDITGDGPVSKRNVYIFEPKGSVKREAKSFRRHVIEYNGDIEVPEDDQELLYTETSDDLKQLIIYCRSTSIKPWSWAEQKLTSICQMFSFSEISMDKHCRKSPAEMLRCTERQLVRTYPRGSRIDSSNYNPLPFWNHGIHMVALNYQTPDMFMHLNQGRFRQNGGCGYVLKPEIMRRGNPGARSQPFDVNMKEPHPLVPACNFDIELLSGQNLCPFGKRCHNVTVSISLHGIPADCYESLLTAETNDSFWPQWELNRHRQKCQILMPELCLLYIYVTNDLRSLGANEIFGQNCIALSSLCPGIKFINLRKSSGELIPESGLFVRMKIEYESPLVHETSTSRENEVEIEVHDFNLEHSASPVINDDQSVVTSCSISVPERSLEVDCHDEVQNNGESNVSENFIQVSAEVHID